MKKKIILLLFLIVILVVIYYQEKFSLIFSNPKGFIDLFLNISRIASFSLYALALNMGIFLLAAIVEIMSIGWTKSSLKRILSNRSKSTYGDLWCWALSIFNLYDLFVLLFSFGLFYATTSLVMHSVYEVHLVNKIGSPIVVFILVFAISDFKHYIWHYFMHKRPFWELHKYHHSATEFNLITTTRGHFLEKGFLTIIDVFVFLLLGVPPEYFIFLAFGREFYAFILHADLNWSLGWFGKYILISPKAHKIHHSNDENHFGKNLGTFFNWWDHLFGTYMDTDEEIKIGVKNTTYNKNGFWMDMVHGTKDFISATLKVRNTN